jgi:hypothetical protein
MMQWQIPSFTSFTFFIFIVPFFTSGLALVVHPGSTETPLRNQRSMENHMKNTRPQLALIRGVNSVTEDAKVEAVPDVSSIPALVIVLISVVTSSLVVLVSLNVSARMSSPVPKGDQETLQEALKEAHAKADSLANEIREERSALCQAHLEDVKGRAKFEAAKMQESATKAKEELQSAGGAALEEAKAASEKAAQSMKIAIKAQEVLSAEVDCIRSRAEAFAMEEKKNLVDKMNNVMASIEQESPTSLSTAFQIARSAMDEAELEAGDGPPIAVISNFRMSTMRFAKMHETEKADFKVRMATAFSTDLSQHLALLLPGSAPVTPHSVNVDMEDTSTKITVTILPPRNTSTESVKTAIATSGNLKSSIVQQVASMPRIEAFTLGSVSSATISSFTTKTEAEWDQFDLPPPGIIIAGAFAPSRLQSLHVSTLRALVYHLLLGMGCGVCFYLDRTVTCNQQHVLTWVYSFLAIQSLCFISQMLLRSLATNTLRVLEQMEVDRQSAVEGPASSIDLGSGSAILAALKDFRKAFAPYNQALAKYDEITSTWAYFWTSLSGVILLIVGVMAVHISVSDVLLDEQFCPKHRVLIFVHVYSFIFLFFVTFNVLWLLGWIVTTAVGCGSSIATKFVIMAARTLDKDVPMKLPIFTSLAQSFILRNGSQQYKQATENHEEDIDRLERKLMALEAEFDKKKELMEALEDLKKDKDLAKLDDPNMLTRNLEQAMAEVEPVVVVAASVSSANLKQIAADAQEAANTASAELQKLAETGPGQAVAAVASEASELMAQAKASARAKASQYADQAASAASQAQAAATSAFHGTPP